MITVGWYGVKMLAE